jgi:hypothetical protein
MLAGTSRAARPCLLPAALGGRCTGRRREAWLVVPTVDLRFELPSTPRARIPASHARAHGGGWPSHGAPRAYPRGPPTSRAARLCVSPLDLGGRGAGWRREPRLVLPIAVAWQRPQTCCPPRHPPLRSLLSPQPATVGELPLPFLLSTTNSSQIPFLIYICTVGNLLIIL